MLINRKSFLGVANVGVRPTIDGNTSKPILEVHLFDLSHDIYGQTVKVVFRKKIREEKKFSGIDELKWAIKNDIAEGKTLLGVS